MLTKKPLEPVLCLDFDVSLSWFSVMQESDHIHRKPASNH